MIIRYGATNRVAFSLVTDALCWPLCCDLFRQPEATREAAPARLTFLWKKTGFRMTGWIARVYTCNWNSNRSRSGHAKAVHDCLAQQFRAPCGLGAAKETDLVLGSPPCRKRPLTERSVQFLLPGTQQNSPGRESQGSSVLSSAIKRTFGASYLLDYAHVVP